MAFIHGAVGTWGGKLSALKLSVGLCYNEDVAAVCCPVGKHVRVVVSRYTQAYTSPQCL